MPVFRHSSHGGAAAGFTLLETLISLSILAIALVAVYRLHYQSIDLSEAVAFDAAAPFLAEKVLSDLELAGIDGVGSDSGTFSEPLPAYRWQADIDEVMLTDDDSDPPKLWKITIVVTGGPRFAYDVTTYRRQASEP